MVCTVSKITHASGTRYYTRIADSSSPEIAQDRDAAGYYVGPTAQGRESTGRWWCSGTHLEREFGIRPGSAVLEEDLQRLYTGEHVVTGEPFLAEPAGDGVRVRAYDLTFAAPKAVSTLWHLADEPLRSQIMAAHEAGVEAALRDVVGQRAGWCRTGKEGKGALVPVDISIAKFTQGDSRPVHLDRKAPPKPGDPHIHTHCVMMAWGQGEDGKYRTIDGRMVYDLQLLAGRTYEAAMAAHLQQLGVRVVPHIQVEQQRGRGAGEKPTRGKQAGFGIAGLPEDLLMKLSKRSSQIAKLAGEEAGARARELGQKRSRTGKEDHAWVDRHSFWRKEVEAHGYDADKIADILSSAISVSPVQPDRREPDWSKFAPLTVENDAVLETSKIEAMITGALIGRGYAVDEIKDIRDRVIRDNYKNVGRDAKDIGDLWTTQKVLDEEAEIKNIAETLGRQHQHRLGNNIVDKVLADYPGLGNEQRDMVRVALSKSDLVIVEGAAGSGKSYCLEPIAKAYRQAGYKIIGASTSWEASGVLEESIKSECLAIAKWSAYWKIGKKLPDNRTVLVIDEAAMTSRQDAIDMLKIASEYGCKIILTGDQQQFKPPGSGDPVRLIDEQLPATSKMRIGETRRQRQQEDRDAATALSDGKPEVMIARSKQVRAWHAVETAQEAIELAARMWGEKRAKGKEVVAIGGTNAEVVVLSQKIRQQLVTEGRIDTAAEQTMIAVDRAGATYDLALAPGDEVRFRRTHKEQGVRNRTRVRVLAIDDEGMKFEHLDKKGRGAGAGYIPWGELQDGRGRIQLEHAYAITAHASQGMTVDEAVVCLANGTSVTNKLYAYVTGSRHRHRCEWIVNYGAMRNSIRVDEGLDYRAEVGDERVEQRILKHLAKDQPKLNADDILKKSAVFSAKAKRHVQHAPTIAEKTWRDVAVVGHTIQQAAAALPSPKEVHAAGRAIADRRRMSILAEVASLAPTLRTALYNLNEAVDLLKVQTTLLIERRRVRLVAKQQDRIMQEERNQARLKKTAGTMPPSKPLGQLVAEASHLLQRIDECKRTQNEYRFANAVDQAAALVADEGWRAARAHEFRVSLQHALSTGMRGVRPLAQRSYVADPSEIVLTLRSPESDKRIAAIDQLVREVEFVTWRRRSTSEQQKIEADLASLLLQAVRSGIDIIAEINRRMTSDSDLAKRLERFATHRQLNLRPYSLPMLKRKRDGRWG